MGTTKTLRDVPQPHHNNLIKSGVSKIFTLFIMIACIIRVIQSYRGDTHIPLEIIHDMELQFIDKQIQSSSSIKCSGNQFFAKTCSDCMTTTLGKEGCDNDCYFTKDKQCKAKEIISKVSCDGHLVDNCHECSEEICSGDCYWGDWIGQRVEIWYA